LLVFAKNGRTRCGEINNPKRNVPISLIAGVGISIVLYLLVNDAFMDVLPLSKLATTGEDNIAALEVARVIPEI